MLDRDEQIKDQKIKGSFTSLSNECFNVILWKC